MTDKTVIGALLESMPMTEAVHAKRAERRKFWKVTVPTSTGTPYIVHVEAPSEKQAIYNAGILMQQSVIDRFRAEAMQGLYGAKAEMVSAFTPTEIPYFDKADPDSGLPPEVFAEVRKSQQGAARRQNQSQYEMPMIPVAHPDATEVVWVSIPAFQLPEYVNKGYKVIGKAAAQRRIGNDPELYYGNAPTELPV